MAVDSHSLKAGLQTNRGDEFSMPSDFHLDFVAGEGSLRKSVGRSLC